MFNDIVDGNNPGCESRYDFSSRGHMTYSLIGGTPGFNATKGCQFLSPSNIVRYTEPFSLAFTGDPVSS